jgi:decaprenylphospho-beta-D-erythro-pentofuranosid-2-ulose 2-reductase
MTGKKVVFLGATRGMGRALARLMAERGDRLFLLGRDPRELDRSLADLAVRGKDAAAGVAYCDLEDTASFGKALDAADQALSGFDTVVVTAGLYGKQEELENDPASTARLLTVDFTNTVMFCEEARRRLLSRGGGRLVVFSSVAGDRGRKPVALYGATKAGLSHYLESLDFRHRGRGLVTTCVKPGFVRTGMTEGLKAPPFAGEPEAVAQRVLAAIDAGKPCVYAPAAWWFVMQVIRRLPRFVMRRVQF